MHTIRNARMTLADASHILSTPTANWTTDQLARARAVSKHWARIRKARTNKE